MLATLPLQHKVRIPANKPETDLDRLANWLKRGETERFVVEAMMTPAMAALLLENNPENRKFQRPTADKWAAAMARGEWHLNGENIIVASTGELNDGQHRLSAVIATGLSVAMSIQFGVSRASRATLNTGLKRTLGDHLAMAGHQNANLLAAAVRLAWQYDAGVYSMGDAPSVDQAFEYIANNPSVGEFLGIGSTIGSQFSTSGAHFAFAGFVCARINHAVARELMDRIKDGLGLSSLGLPAARVRERLMNHLTGKFPLRRNEPSAIFIKAFNAANQGRRLRSLAWTAVGPTGEPYPVAGQ